MEDKINRERLSAKMICDICIAQNIQAKEAIKIIVETLAHMIKYSNGSLEDKLIIMDHINEGIKESIKEVC